MTEQSHAHGALENAVWQWLPFRPCPVMASRSAFTALEAASRNIMRRNRRTFFVGLILCGIGLFFWLAYRADQRYVKAGAMHSAPLSIVPPATIELTGSWVGEMDNILNIRPDGSGRSRITTNPIKGISYFEWRFDPATRKFTIVETSDNLLAKARDKIIGEDAFGFSISEISNDEFDLVNPLNGHAQRFVRTQDRSVESAP